MKTVLKQYIIAMSLVTQGLKLIETELRSAISFDPSQLNTIVNLPKLGLKLHATACQG